MISIIVVLFFLLSDNLVIHPSRIFIPHHEICINPLLLFPSQPHPLPLPNWGGE